ncbi:MAG: diaminobutyrate acetyltransferase [Burkholderiales bacterium]|nr:diaminobutyrate acetyltransferase [Burkholderiales bacterium]
MKTRPTATVAPASSNLILREPGIDDGAAVHQLVRACPPLDLNSPYAYLLLCAHHARTCVVAEGPAGIAGFISAYRLPADPEVVFVWQVAVAPVARGQGLALRMLEHLLARPALAGWRRLETTITPCNKASRRVFETLAARLQLRLSESAFFSKEDFADPQHEPEMLIRIGPCIPQA